MSIKIFFDNPQAVYFAGQTIVGRVKVNIHEALSTKGVAIKFTGQAHTSWTTGTGDNKSRHTGREEYYTGKVYLLGNGTDTVSISPGQYEYPISFTLPLNIPSSFESITGYVRHQCKAKINIPWGFDITDIQPISVNHIYDLNIDENAMRPVNRKEKKTFSFSSGCIFLSLMIERTGFVPGEKLRVHCEVENESGKTIEYVKMELTQMTLYRTYPNGGFTTMRSLPVAEMGAQGIKGKGPQVVWSNTGLIIPAVPASYLQHCNIIEISYSLNLTMSPSGFTRNLDMEQPIIIGSIPLRQHFSLYQMVSNRTAPGEPLNMAANSPAAPGMSIPPPSAPPPIGMPQPTNASAPALPNTGSGDIPPAYDSKWLNETGKPPLFPGLEQYPEMPPPLYSASQHSVPMDDAQDSKGVPPGPFIPSYVMFNTPNSRPSSPH